MPCNLHITMSQYIYIFNVCNVFILFGILYMYDTKGHLDCVVQGHKSYIDL